ncbi:MAG: HAMP domain-containing sensor histidine kinase [Planctomycetota bacterium]|nr:HAMP domain-containing sensor histidine kinase [Planctomycetota bacterium]
MSLRARMLGYVVAVMAIVFVMVAVTILPDTIRDPKVTLAAGDEAATTLQVLFQRLSASERRALLQSDAPLFHGRHILRGWLLVTLDGDVQAWAMPEPDPGRVTDDYLARQHFNHMLSVFTPDGEKLLLYARTARSIEPVLDLWGLFLVMAVGTLFLVLVIYGLMLRLVIKPVERLAAATRSPAVAKGLLPQVPHTERKDEVGELVRAYNQMAAEVNDLRSNLERRVAEATRDLEAAQNQIVVSERLSAAGRMAAGVAHEINNPLGGMLNATRSLKARAAPGSRDSEYLDLVLEGLSRIQNIMANLLQFSRPVQQAAAVNLADVLDGALLFCQHRFGKVNVQVEKDCPQGPDAQPAVVLGHRAELGQVFLNLLVNALDAMEANGPGPHTLTLRLRRNGTQVCASVADTGAGMTAKELEQAGRFFYSTKGEGKGTGLGLAVAQHIVLQHGGRLKIESTPGKGTTVTVILPVGQT